MYICVWRQEKQTETGHKTGDGPLGKLRLLISFLATKRPLPITLSVHAYVRPTSAYYLPGHFDCINIGIRLHPYLGNIILLMNANIINAMQCSNFGCILADDYAGKGGDCLAGENAMIGALKV